MTHAIKWRDGTLIERPWEREYWKPSNRIRDVIKAMPQILAEIDRFQRAQGEKP
jgi:hypothetical protein